MFKKRERTPQQQASRAQKGIFVRLIGCGYLIYLMVTLINTAREESSTSSSTWKYVVAGIMIVLSVAVIAVTLFSAYKSWKSGMFKANTYYSAEERAAIDAETERDQPDDGEAEDDMEDVQSDDEPGVWDGDPWDSESDGPGDEEDPWDSQK